MYNHLLYLSYWIINSILLFFVSMLLDQGLLYGNSRFSPVEAAIYAGFWMTFILWVFWDFAIARKIKFEKRSFMFSFFFCVNLFALWAVSRFSHFMGFQQTNFLLVFVIAVLTTVAQRMVRGIIVKNSIH